ncbi:MAG: hypothetical protein GY846_19030 [Deltaproteobacteria bacterium]|nr:hypothetical protein [Deltaproteobacteria bacterium]
MNPIPPSAILSLAQTGWRIDMLFRICVQAINGIHNSAGGRLDALPADPVFYRLIALLRKIQASAAMGMRIQRTKNKKQTTLIIFRKKNVKPNIAVKIDAVRKLLGLNPDLKEFKVVYGSLADDDREMAIQSRSMMEILGELAAYIDDRHVAERSATPAVVEEESIAVTSLRSFGSKAAVRNRMMLLQQFTIVTTGFGLIIGTSDQSECSVS